MTTAPTTASLARVFHGWRVVAVCFVAAVFAWGLGVFGSSVYLNQITRQQGWSISLVSAAITAFYLTGALSPAIIAALIGRFGARPVFMVGALALGAGTIAMGQVATVWQLIIAFILLGTGYAALSVTGISTTLAPWFEQYQGRSVAVALMGASVGAMLVVPALITATTWFGFSAATLAGGLVVVGILLPLAAIVLRYRRPEDLGLPRDGRSARTSLGLPDPGSPGPEWNRPAAMRTAAFWSTAIGFAIGLMVQVGFFTHQVILAKPLLGTAGAGWLVSATGFANLLGRLMLARIVDHVAVRPYSAGIFAAQAATLALIALVPTAPVLITACAVYGFCLGQITTLSPIIVRREFGLVAFGPIYGVAATIIQLTSAFGPGLYGVLHDAFGSYTAVLIAAAALELAAMIVILAGGVTVRREQKLQGP